MSTSIIRPKDRGEWLKIRKNGIGSSEVATIVGLNPYETPYQLWRRKVGMDEQKKETFAMKAGHYLEDAVSRFWADETKREVIKRSAGDWLIRNDERPFLQVSPDRTYWLSGESKNNNNRGILECKTTQMSVDVEDIPKHWFCQVQYQLGVAGYEHGSLAWLICGRKFGYKDIEFNKDFYEWMIEQVENFWFNYVLAKKEPSAVSVKDVLLKYNKHLDGKIIEVGDDIFDACEQLKGVKKEIKQLEAVQTEIEEKIKMVFGDAEGISYDGETLATWKAPKPSEKFDSKAFKADEPELYAKYVSSAQGARRFMLK